MQVQGFAPTEAGFCSHAADRHRIDPLALLGKMTDRISPRILLSPARC